MLNKINKFIINKFIINNKEITLQYINKDHRIIVFSSTLDTNIISSHEGNTSNNYFGVLGISL